MLRIHFHSEYRHNSNHLVLDANNAKLVEWGGQLNLELQFLPAVQDFLCGAQNHLQDPHQ